MRILALILARGGSKRVPGKNLRLLGDKPLVTWSIDVAQAIPEICDILVSTDSAAIASVSSQAGALVPWLRPDTLATDTSSSVDAALHALDWYELEKGAVDGILLLQPTSPFRTKETLRKGIALFSNNQQRAVLAVSPAHTHPMWAFRLEKNGLVPFMQENGLLVRYQDLPPAYEVNGGLYLVRPAELREFRSFIGVNAAPLIVESPQEAMDIDTEWDFKMAEAVLKYGHER